MGKETKKSDDRGGAVWIYISTNRDLVKRSGQARGRLLTIWPAASHRRPGVVWKKESSFGSLTTCPAGPRGDPLPTDEDMPIRQGQGKPARSCRVVMSRWRWNRNIDPPLEQEGMGHGPAWDGHGEEEPAPLVRWPGSGRRSGEDFPAAWTRLGAGTPRSDSSHD